MKSDSLLFPVVVNVKIGNIKINTKLLILVTFEFGNYYGWFRYLSYNGSDIYRFNYDKQLGYSIRCVKD